MTALEAPLAHGIALQSFSEVLELRSRQRIGVESGSQSLQVERLRRLSWRYAALADIEGARTFRRKLVS